MAIIIRYAYLKDPKIRLYINYLGTKGKNTNAHAWSESLCTYITFT